MPAGVMFSLSLYFATAAAAIAHADLGQRSSIPSVPVQLPRMMVTCIIMNEVFTISLGSRSEMSKGSILAMDFTDCGP